jgi:hypothetical protein
MKSNGVFSSAKKLLVIAFEKEVDYVCTAWLDNSFVCKNKLFY